MSRCALLCMSTRVVFSLPPSLGLPGDHPEGGASHGLHGRPSGLGEDAGGDEVRRSQVFDRAQESGGLGQRCGSAGQSEQDVPVRISDSVTSSTCPTLTPAARLLSLEGTERPGTRRSAIASPRSLCSKRCVRLWAWTAAPSATRAPPPS